MILIEVYDADDWHIVRKYWTDEKPADIIKAIEDNVAVYESKAELVAANNATEGQA